MSWLFQLESTQPVAHSIGVLALVCVAGMALGSIKLRGVGLGTAGVLFTGILGGHLGKPVDQATLAFVKEFGLVLFVFTTGLQLGPGFFAALRQQGVKQNALAATIVLLGAASAPLIGWLAGFDTAAVLGVFSGASVKMPSLGAATQTLGSLPHIAPDRLALPALACAVTFPTGIVASLATLLLLSKLLRIHPAQEAAAYAAMHRRVVEPLERRTLVVTNPDLDGVRLDTIPGRLEAGVSIARVRHGEETSAATALGSKVIEQRTGLAGWGRGQFPGCLQTSANVQTGAPGFIEEHPGGRGMHRVASGVGVIAFLFLGGVRGAGQSPTNAPVATAGPVVPAAEAPAAGGVEEDARKWAFSASIYTYIVPDSREYVQPTFTADRDWLHLEARYNYEALETGSAWIGYNFGIGEKLRLEFTPMLGGVFGEAFGIAPGYEASLSWWRLELATEGELVIDADGWSDSFFYTWSELTLAPTDWFRFGIAVQRTKVYETDFDVQRGFLVGFTYKWVDLATYVFNPDDDPTFVVAVTVDF